MSRRGKQVPAQSMPLPSHMSEGWIGVVADSEAARRPRVEVPSQK